MNMRIAAILLLGYCAGMSTPAFAQKKDKLKKGPNISLNISAKKDSVKTTYLNIGLLTNIYQLKGIGINAVSSVVQNDMTGFQISGLASITGRHASGFQLGGIANVAGGNANGIMLSGLMNVAGGKANGIQISGLGNIAGNISRGVTIGGQQSPRSSDSRLGQHCRKITKWHRYRRTDERICRETERSTSFHPAQYQWRKSQRRSSLSHW